MNYECKISMKNIKLWNLLYKMLNLIIWRIIEVQNEEGEVQMILKVDSRNEFLVFSALGLDGKLTKAKFDIRRFPGIKTIFQSGLHKVLLTVNSNSVILYLDCEKIGTRKMRPKPGFEIFGSYF